MLPHGSDSTGVESIPRSRSWTLYPKFIATSSDAEDVTDMHSQCQQ